MLKLSRCRSSRSGTELLHRPRAAASVHAMPGKRPPLPPPEWYEEFRLLHLHYGQEHGDIAALAVSEDEKRSLSMRLYVETEQVRKGLMREAVRKLRCTGVRPNGERCSRPARPDYIGQKCTSHAPDISEYPDLPETRRRLYMSTTSGQTWTTHRWP